VGAVRKLNVAPSEPSESDLLKQQLARVQQAFYDEKTRPTDLKALSIEMRELRALIKSAEASENKRTTVVADTPDEPIG
jgi:hypothetical protein